MEIPTLSLSIPQALFRAKAIQISTWKLVYFKSREESRDNSIPKYTKSAVDGLLLKFVLLF